MRKTSENVHAVAQAFQLPEEVLYCKLWKYTAKPEQSTIHKYIQTLLGLVLVQWREEGRLTEELGSMPYVTAYFAATKLSGQHQKYIAQSHLLLITYLIQTTV